MHVKFDDVEVKETDMDPDLMAESIEIAKEAQKRYVEDKVNFVQDDQKKRILQILQRLLCIFGQTKSREGPLFFSGIPPNHNAVNAIQLFLGINWMKFEN
jgi:hypothetical protein